MSSKKDGILQAYIIVFVLSQTICNPDFEFNATGSDTSSDTGSDTRVNNAEKILVLIGKKPNISASEIAALIGISSRAVEKQLKKLRDSGIIRHTGPKFGGQWEILKKQ